MFMYINHCSFCTGLTFWLTRVRYPSWGTTSVYWIFLLLVLRYVSNCKKRISPNIDLVNKTTHHLCTWFIDLYIKYVYGAVQSEESCCVCVLVFNCCVTLMMVFTLRRMLFNINIVQGKRVDRQALKLIYCSPKS